MECRLHTGRTHQIRVHLAYAGNPFTDLGNLLRFERDPGFVDGVLSGYVDRRGGEPATVLALARAADLWAIIDLATRRHDNPVAAEADRLLRQLAIWE